MLNKLKERMLEQKVAVGEAVIDVLTKKVTKEVRDKRYDICKSCEHLYVPSTYKQSYRDWETDRKSTRLNSSHLKLSRMPSSA